MYSFKFDEEEVKKAKGVKKHVVKNDISHEDYKDCLNGEKVKMNQQCSFKSIKHDIYAIEQSKVGLSVNDDKSYYLDSVTSLRYGHYVIFT